MEIKINIDKRLVEHLKSPHLFYDECEPACTVLRMVQKEINKKLKRGERMKGIIQYTKYTRKCII
jgi:hypothetical protein